MTDQQQSQQESTAQLQQTTMSQGQEAIEQAIDLQRNMARMALSAMQWQDTAQQQGLEITKSMLQGFPGQQFAKSMVQSYLEGLEAVMPEMERAMEKGMQAAAQPGMEMGQQMEQTGQRMERASHGMNRQGTTAGMRSTGTSDPRSGGRTGGQWSQQAGESQQYQTGEWISPERTYGGESSGTMGERRPREALAGGQFGSEPQRTQRGQQGQFGDEMQSQRERFDPDTQSQGGRIGRGSQQSRPEQSRGGEQSQRRPIPQGSRSSPQHEEGMHAQPARGGRGEGQRGRGQQEQRGQRGRPRNRYSQRIDTDRRADNRGRQRRPIAQGDRRNREESTADEFDAAESPDYESADVDAERDYDTGETPQDDMEVSAERSEDERAAETDADADLESEDFETDEDSE